MPIHYCSTGPIVSGEVIWQYLCHEKAKEVGNAKQGTGERLDIVGTRFCRRTDFVFNGILYIFLICLS